IFDPLCGSGMVGIVSYMLNRNFIMGDLNPSGKSVFSHLLDYYLKNNALFQDIKVSTWWKKRSIKDNTYENEQFLKLAQALSLSFKEIPIYWDGKK
ncbi:MAG: hypothetical protein ACK4OO_02515, partial [bacterium]